MVTFRCKQSGNTVSFSDPADIESMRKEPHYEEVKHESQKASVSDVPKEANEAREEVLKKKRGRPASIDL